MKTGGFSGLWRPPLWTAFAWGFAEATLFFLVPDIILSWCALAHPRDGVRAFVAIIVGSLLGGALVYETSRAAPAKTADVIRAVPFVRAAMFDTVSREYAAHGASAQLRGPTSGIPYKVYAAVAPEHVGLAAFLVVSVPARLERLAASWVVFTAVGCLLRRRRTAHRILTAAIFVAGWTVVYAIYWSKI